MQVVAIHQHAGVNQIRPYVVGKRQNFARCSILLHHVVANVRRLESVQNDHLLLHDYQNASGYAGDQQVSVENHPDHS